MVSESSFLCWSFFNSIPNYYKMRKTGGLLAQGLIQTSMTRNSYHPVGKQEPVGGYIFTYHVITALPQN